MNTPLEHPDLIGKVASAITHLAEIQSSVPGPIAGDHPKGILWPDVEVLTFNSIHDVERHFDSRLKGKPKLDFKDFKLVLCHLDIHPQNILWLADGSMCLLDWESAGFYPRLFQICYHRTNYGRWVEFDKLLWEAMEPLTVDEETQVDLFSEAWSNSQRFHL